MSIIVPKQAAPPTKLEIGSAINTPSVPMCRSDGRNKVSGVTITTFRKMEKNTACLDFPRATNTACPANWRDIIKKPKKYRRRAGIPASIRAGSWLNIRMKNSGKPCSSAHTRVV